MTRPFVALHQYLLRIEKREIDIRSRLVLVGDDEAKDMPVSWRIWANTPESRLSRWIYVYFGIWGPEDEKKVVTKTDREALWRTLRDAQEHLVTEMNWDRVDVDSLEFVLRILVGLSLIKSRLAGHE